MPDTAIGRCVACWQTIVGIFCVAMLTAMFASSWELDPNEVSASAIEPLMLIPYSFPTTSWESCCYAPAPLLLSGLPADRIRIGSPLSHA